LATADLAAQARRPWRRILLVAHGGRLLPAVGGLAIFDGIAIIGAVGIARGTRPSRASWAVGRPSPSSGPTRTRSRAASLRMWARVSSSDSGPSLLARCFARSPEFSTQI